MDQHKIVSREAWVQARVALLEREKAFTRARDALSMERRCLPWVEVTKPYTFNTNEGEKALADLFGDPSQLVVYHFMYGPDWQTGCKSCSFWADNFDRNIAHLAARDVTLVAVSRAPLETLNVFRRRMDWSFDWVSSGGSDFNYDFDVSFTPEMREKREIRYNYQASDFPVDDAPGISVFCKGEDATIYHTYSTYGRGLDMLNAGYHYLDLVPKGRDEDGNQPMSWLKLRDSYAANGA